MNIFENSYELVERTTKEMVDETLLYRVFAYKQICFLLCKLECEKG